MFKLYENIFYFLKTIVEWFFLTNASILVYVEYIVNNNSTTWEAGRSLVDRGANGGVRGSDAKVIRTYMRKVNISGIEDHTVNSLSIVDCAAKIKTHAGPVIGIFRQYADLGTGRTIHSSLQIEYNKIEVYNKSRSAGGKQCIRTNYGYIVPLDIIQGLPYMPMEPYSEEEFEDLPHVFFTSDEPWKPRVYDSIISDREDWLNDIPDITHELISTPFDQYGNYRNREPPEHNRTTNDADQLDNDEMEHNEKLSSFQSTVDDNSTVSTATTHLETDDDEERPDIELRRVFELASNLDTVYLSVPPDDTDSNSDSEYSRCSQESSTHTDELAQNGVDTQDSGTRKPESCVSTPY